MKFMDSSITSRQKDLLIKSLNYMERHKKLISTAKNITKIAGPTYPLMR